MGVIFQEADPLNMAQGYILCKILWPGGVGKKWCRGKKWKMSQWGTKWKEEKRGKEKEEKDVAEIGAPHHKKQD